MRKDILIYKWLFFVFVLSSLISAHAQERYIDSLFAELSVQTLTFSDTLKLDIYSPKKDIRNKRPLLLLVHGGGFASGRRDNPLEKEFSITMAKKGYVVASMSYRLLRKDAGFGCNCPASEKVITFKTASEDVLNATNYLVKNSESIGIDINKIILIGSSAGAEAVLNTVYMQYHRDFKNLPYQNLKYAGVISFSGAILNAEYITNKTALPTLLFHGVHDKLVPIGSSPHHFCAENELGYLPLDGPKTIVEKLKKFNVPFQFFEDSNGNHDWANLAYSYTNEIANFINKVVLNKENVQSTIKLVKRP